MSESKGRFSDVAGKAANYGKNRLMHGSIRDASRITLAAQGRAAASSLRIKKVSAGEVRAALDGVYGDEGAARFAEMAREQGLDEDGLQQIEERHQAFFRVSFGSAILILVGMLAMLFLGRGILAYSGALILLFFMLAVMARAIQADHAAFQVRNRRVCGLREYYREGFLKGRP